MRRVCALIFALCALMCMAPAYAADRGVVIRAGDIKTAPFIDAGSAGPVAANEPVTIVDRKGGWMQVQATGKTGWIRMLNVRLASAEGVVAHSSSLSTSAALLRRDTMSIDLVANAICDWWSIMIRVWLSGLSSVLPG